MPEKTLKIIDLPDSIFLVCALSLKDMFERQGHEAVLLVRTGKRGGDWYFKYKLDLFHDAIPEAGDLAGAVAGRDVEFVVWHHANSYSDAFRETVARIGRAAGSLVISFYPDGIANYALPRPIDEGFFAVGGTPPVLGAFYNFGIDNFTVPADFCSQEIASVTVPVHEVARLLQPLRKRFDHHMRPFWQEVEASLDVEVGRLCIVVLRNWCAGGYGNRYNFGNGTATLSDIYLDLIRHYRAGNPGATFVLRDDSRTRKMHPELVSEIARKVGDTDFLLFPESYPSFLNLEFFLAARPPSVRCIDMIVLDSLSGFYAPFLAPEGTIVMGASDRFIAGQGATEEQRTAITGNTQARMGTIERVWSSARDHCADGTFSMSSTEDNLHDLRYSGYLEAPASSRRERIRSIA